MGVSTGEDLHTTPRRLSSRPWRIAGRCLDMKTASPCTENKFNLHLKISGATSWIAPASGFLGRFVETKRDPFGCSAGDRNGVAPSARRRREARDTASLIDVNSRKEGLGDLRRVAAWACFAVGHTTAARWVLMRLAKGQTKNTAGPGDTATGVAPAFTDGRFLSESGASAVASLAGLGNANDIVWAGLKKDCLSIASLVAGWTMTPRLVLKPRPDADIPIFAPEPTRLSDMERRSTHAAAESYSRSRWNFVVGENLLYRRYARPGICLRCRSARLVMQL